MLVLDFQGVMFNWEWLDQVATSPSPASSAVVINQLQRQHPPEIKDFGGGVRVAVSIENEGVCDRNVHFTMYL